MSLNLAGIPLKEYVGLPVGRPVQIAGVSAKAVALTLNWLAYGAGTLVPNLSVRVSLFGTNVQNLPKIRSVYIDNTNSNVPLYVTALDTGHTVQAAPQSSQWQVLITNDVNFSITGIGFSNDSLPQTSIFFTDVAVPPSSDLALNFAIQEGLASPIIALQGSGGLLSGPSIIAPGSCYTNGNLVVTGGGGTGGLLQGTVNQYGQFSVIAVTAGGQNYTGVPVITPGGFTARPVWSGLTNYVLFNQVNYGGSLYECTAAVGPTPSGFGLIPAPAPPADLAHWHFICPINAVAAFTVGITPTVGSVVIATNSNYAPKALGDQPTCYTDAINAIGVFQNNVFNTPYNSGYIYLTNIHVGQQSNNAIATTWQLETSLGQILYDFQGAASPMVLLSMSGMNLRLPATLTWRLNMTTFGGGANPISLAHYFAWTYNLI